MSANKMLNVHHHRIRHRRRLDTTHPNFAARHPKLQNHLDVSLAEMNAIGGVAGVTAQECLTSIEANVTLNPVGARDIRARDQRGATTVANVEALGIPIA